MSRATAAVRARPTASVSADAGDAFHRFHSNHRTSQQANYKQTTGKYDRHTSLLRNHQIALTSPCGHAPAQGLGRCYGRCGVDAGSVQGQVTRGPTACTRSTCGNRPSHLACRSTCGCGARPNPCGSASHGCCAQARSASGSRRGSRWGYGAGQGCRDRCRCHGAGREHFVCQPHHRYHHAGAGRHLPPRRKWGALAHQTPRQQPRYHHP